MIYLLLKSIHVISVVAFVSGVLIQSHTLRLYKSTPVPQMPDGRLLLSRIRQWDLLITVPALTMTWVFGLAAALHAGWFSSGWLKAKLAVVVILSMIHGVQSGKLRWLSDPDNEHGKIQGQSPALIYGLVITAVGLAVFKPW